MSYAEVITVREIRDIVGSRPLTDDELTDSKNQLINLFPQQFQTYPGIASQMGSMFFFDLPDDELDTYVSRIDSVDAAMVNQFVRDHFHPDALLIVVVGDRKKIEPGIRELGLGEIHFVDAQGNLVE
jgi:zinc protease